MRKTSQLPDSPRRPTGKKATVTTLKLSTVKTGKLQKGSHISDKPKKAAGPAKKKGLPAHKKKELGGPS